MTQQTFLVIGSGGREHALAWKLSVETPGRRVFVTPGSAAISADPEVRGHSVDVGIDDFDALAEFARRESVDLTVVGPEAPLCAGIVDYFEQRDLPIFGPKRSRAALEGSKSFAKEIMLSAKVPTAAHRVFENRAAAIDYVSDAAHPLVIKADGLAGGKGVSICEDVDRSVETLRSYMSASEHRDGAAAQFGAASRRVVIEEFLEGTEMSFMVVADGERFAAFSPSKDHKRLGDGGVGPNTGGMGAVAPSMQQTAALNQQIHTRIIEPVLAEFRARGRPYRGFLYAGLMLTKSGPKVLEFNCRMGDPETQALLFAMSANLGEVLLRAGVGRLKPDDSLACERRACCVVLASKGYPGHADSGHMIRGLDAAAALGPVKIFHAGTRMDEETGRFINSGGRVLGVTARADTAAGARRLAYRAVAEIDWPGMYFRGDIGV